MDFNILISFIAIIVVFWMMSYVATGFLKIFEKFAKKTSSSLDDKIIACIKLPIRYLFLIFGLFTAVKYYGIEYKFRDFGVDEFFVVLVIILACFTVSRLLNTFFAWYGRKQRSKRISKTMFVFVSKVSNVFIYGIALVMILSEAGVEIGPLIAGLGVAGLAIALGLQEALASLFAALFLVMDKSINIGDYIQLEDGTKAYIEDISWRTVRIRTIGGNSVIVPNNVFAGQKISSYDYPESPMYTSVMVGVSYDSDLDLVEKIAIEAGKKVIEKEGVKIKENNPVVRFKLLGESSIDLSLIMQIDSVLDESKIKSALIKQIITDFRENNIDIPFPQRVIRNA